MLSCRLIIKYCSLHISTVQNCTYTHASFLGSCRIYYTITFMQLVDTIMDMLYISCILCHLLAWTGIYKCMCSYNNCRTYTGVCVSCLPFIAATLMHIQNLIYDIVYVCMHKYYRYLLHAAFIYAIVESTSIFMQSVNNN